MIFHSIRNRCPWLVPKIPFTLTSDKGGANKGFANEAAAAAAALG